jgi:CubicO group peptidase (beta-lactamase class C family)
MSDSLTLATSDADFSDCGIERARVAYAVSAARSWVESGETTGLVVAAARKGTVILHEAFGVLRPDDDVLMSVDAIFPIASITKPIIATAVMCLVEDGLVGLNQPVGAYIPEFAGAERANIAVWHLLSHTAGFDETVGIEVDPSLSGSEAIASFVESTCRIPISAPPGAVFSYSLFGYELAAEIVRRVSGEPIERFVQHRVLDRLGMKDTYLVVPEGVQSRIALRYAQQDASRSDRYVGRYEQERHQRTPWAGSGGFSVAFDLLTFGQAFLQNGTYGGACILSPASVRLMTTPQTDELPLQFDDENWTRASWGLGWHIHGNTRGRRGASLYSPSTFEHVGMGGSLLWVDPENEVVGVCLSLVREGSAGLYPAWRYDRVVNALMAALD